MARTIQRRFQPVSSGGKRTRWRPHRDTGVVTESRLQPRGRGCKAGFIPVLSCRKVAVSIPQAQMANQQLFTQRAQDGTLAQMRAMAGMGAGMKRGPVGMGGGRRTRFRGGE